MDKILIVGALGQDGLNITPILSHSNEVHGIFRNNFKISNLNYYQEKNNINLHQIDATEFKKINKLIKEIKPSIIINFAGETNTINPWINVENTFKQNFNIPFNIMESIVKLNLDTFFFQSSSSLMYSRSGDQSIDENSKINPMYPYGISKASSHMLLKEYRIKYGLKCSSGIFFNHESVNRDEKFLTKKLSTFIKKVKSGENVEKLNLYNLNYFRDISHSEDFMEGVTLIINNKINDDFIFSSGVLTNILNFTKKFFYLHDLDFNYYVNYIESNNHIEDYKIYGNNSKLKKFGWSPKYLTIDSIIRNIVEKELNLIKY